MKADRKLEFIFADMFWRCEDCNNMYSIDIKSCSNELIDSWVMMGVISKEKIKEMGHNY